MIQETPPVTWVDTPEEMLKFVKHVRATKECAVDTETTGLNRWKDHVIIWSACPSIDSRYCFSREMLEIYDKELSQNTQIKWYFTNQTFDFCMLWNSGVRVPAGDSYCTLAMDWLYNENRRGGHGLKETAWEYLELRMEEFKSAFEGKAKETIQDRLLRGLKDDFRRSISYASIDAWATFGVFHVLKKQLADCCSSKGLPYWDHFETVEMPFTRCLANLIHRGMMVDSGYLEELAPKMEKSISDIERRLIKLAGRDINLNSPKQLQWLLFDKLKLKPIKMTKGGASGKKQPATDNEVLSIYAEEGVEACQVLMEHRKLSKTLGTYVKGLHKWLDPELRVHPTLTQHVTVTGRLSSTDPNLQNIPRPDNDVYGLREAFIPKEGYAFVVADYEQLEMRLLAHMSGEENMQAVINKGWDIHAGTACVMYGYDYDELNAAIKRKKQAGKDPNIHLTELEKSMVFARQAAKSIGFGRPVG